MELQRRKRTRCPLRGPLLLFLMDVCLSQTSRPTCSSVYTLQPIITDLALKMNYYLAGKLATQAKLLIHSTIELHNRLMKPGAFLVSTMLCVLYYV